MGDCLFNRATLATITERVTSSPWQFLSVLFLALVESFSAVEERDFRNEYPPACGLRFRWNYNDTETSYLPPMAANELKQLFPIPE